MHTKLGSDMVCHLQFGQLKHITNLGLAREHSPRQDCALPPNGKTVVNGELEGACGCSRFCGDTLDNLLYELLCALSLHQSLSCACMHAVKARLQQVKVSCACGSAGRLAKSCRDAVTGVCSACGRGT